MITHRDAVGRQGRRRNSAAPFPSQSPWLSPSGQCGRPIGWSHGLARKLAAAALILLGACSATVLGQTVTVFDIGYASGPYGIAAGADENLWFGETYGYSVGRITPSGVITHFPPPFAQVNEIAPGPDGNMWFTETLWSTIGRITPAGIITEYLCYPGPQDYLHGRLPRHITAGPDGALWFANSVGTIGRITTDGVVSEFPVTDPSAT